MTEPSAIISPRGVQRLDAGHPWIYRSDVRSAAAEPGEIVRVCDERGRFLGRAFFSDRSQICLRFLTRDDVPADRAFFIERIRAAANRRKTMVEGTEAFRLVHAEGDLLPSLVVDRYADYLVIQTLSQGTDRIKPMLVEILCELFSPRGILERNDPRVRMREGLEQKTSVLTGDVPAEVIARFNGLCFCFDLFHGQKTGGFLDQRENYRAAARYARGQVLDCFTYSGGFALTAASRAEHVEALDLSASAIESCQRNQQLNNITNAAFRVANAFDALKECDEAGRRFDAIILDPPAFAKDRQSVPAAIRGYKEINLRSLKLLNPGGHLITCSCSHHISEALFLQTIAEAATDVRCTVSIVERRTQAGDHPILLTVPETHYLKCLILQRLD